MTLRYILGALGAAPFAASLLAVSTASPPEIKPRMVKTETIRQIPLGPQHPFAERWHFPLPKPEPTVVTVRTNKIEPEPVAKPAKVTYHYRTRRVQDNICQRHGMRKVNYGRRWRCRR